MEQLLLIVFTTVYLWILWYVVTPFVIAICFGLPVGIVWLSVRWHRDPPAWLRIRD